MMPFKNFKSDTLTDLLSDLTSYHAEMLNGDFIVEDAKTLRETIYSLQSEMRSRDHSTGIYLNNKVA